MAIFLGVLGLVLGLMVVLAGLITFARGLPTGVLLRPGRTNPRRNVSYLVSQVTLGSGVALLALDVVLRLADRPFLLPGIICVCVPLLIKANRRLRLFAKGRDAARK